MTLFKWLLFLALLTMPLIQTDATTKTEQVNVKRLDQLVFDQLMFSDRDDNVVDYILELAKNFDASINLKEVLKMMD